MEKMSTQTGKHVSFNPWQLASPLARNKFWFTFCVAPMAFISLCETCWMASSEMNTALNSTRVLCASTGDRATGPECIKLRCQLRPERKLQSRSIDLITRIRTILRRRSRRRDRRTNTTLMRTWPYRKTWKLRNNEWKLNSPRIRIEFVRAPLKLAVVCARALGSHLHPLPPSATPYKLRHYARTARAYSECCNCWTIILSFFIASYVLFVRLLCTFHCFLFGYCCFAFIIVIWCSIGQHSNDALTGKYVQIRERAACIRNS